MPVSLASVIRAFDIRAQEEVYTALPAVVEKYDPATGEVDVKLAVKLVKRSEDGSPVYFECPVISNVSVCYPRGGGYEFSFPLTQGDSGLLVVSTLDCSDWELSGVAPVEPAHLMRQNLSSCVFLPGWFPTPKPPSPLDTAARTAGAVLGVGGGTQIRITPTEIDLGRNATNFVALANLVAAELAAIRTAYNTHTHGVGAVGSPTSTPVTPMAAPGPVAATKVKAE